MIVLFLATVVRISDPELNEFYTTGFERNCIKGTCLVKSKELHFEISVVSLP
jgi:hypothetical protein